MARLERLRSEELVAVVLFTFLVLGAYGVAESDVLASGNPTGDLVAHYRFDEGAGATVYDTTDNDYHVDLYHFDFNATSGWTSGISGSGGALLFDGVNDSARNDNIDLSHVGENESFAVSGWFKTDSTAEQTLFGMTRDAFVGDSDSNAHLLIENSGWLTWLIEPGYRQGGHYIAPTSDTFNDGKWHHVYAERERHTWKIYVDGKLRSSEVNESFNEGLRSNANFDMGAYRDRNDYFDGAIAEARLWATNLSDSQIKALYNRGSSVRFGTEDAETRGKVLDMSFDRWNGTHVFDTSGNRNHGKQQFDSKQRNIAFCKTGRCYNFDGADDRHDIPHDTELNLTEKITLSVWIKPTGSYTNNDRVIAKGSEPETYTIAVEETSPHTIKFGREEEDGTDHTIDSTTAVTPGEWMHIAGVDNGTEMRLYINGVREGTLDSSTFSGGGTSGSLSIGCSDTYSGECFNGTIDQVKVFDRALSRQEIVEEAGIDRGGAVLDMRFDEGAGRTVHDTSMYGNDGSMRPNETEGPQWTSGISGNALTFDGEDSYVQVPDAASLNVSEAVTLSSWVKVDEFSDSGEHFPISKYDYGNNGYSYTLLNNGGDQGEIRVDIYTENSQSSWSTGVNVPEDVWRHVVARYNGSHLAVFVDGKQKATTPRTGDVLNSQLPATIGTPADAQGDTSYTLSGKIDAPRIYPFALSNERITEMYRRGSSRIGKQTDQEQSPQTPPTEDLALHHTFDRVNGTHSLDATGPENHGKLVNQLSELSTVDCKVGRCLRFNKPNDGHIDVQKDGQFFGTMPNFTISTWANWPTMSGNWQYILNFGTSSGSSGSVGIARSDSNAIKFFIYNSSGRLVGGSKCTVNTDIQNDKWYHIVGQWENGRQRVYKNGELAGGCSLDGAWDGITESMKFVGKSNWNEAAMNGTLDELRVYNRTLSNSSIWQLYTAGRDRSGSNRMAGPLAWWRMDARSGNVTYDVAEDHDGATNGRLLDDWEDGDIDGWSLNCGGSPEYEMRDGYLGGDAVWLNATGGDGLACIHRASEDYDAVAGTNIRFRCKGHGCYTCVWNGTECVNSGEGASSNGYVPKWTVFETTVDTTQSNVNFYFYNDGTVGHAATYDIIGEGPLRWTGKTGSARNFDGTDDYVNVSTFPDRTFNTISFTAWTKITGDTGVTQQLFESNTAGGEYFLETDGNMPYRMRFNIHNDTGMKHEISAGTFNSGEWHHFAATYDGATQKLYVDGKLAAESPVTGAVTFTDPQVLGMDNDMTNQPLDGMIDDVRIYPYALNQEQVKNVMRRGSTSFG